MPFDDRDFPDLPRGERAITPRSRRMVGLWLYTIAGMILVMIGLGGATRLTGSGLSIMEWAPIMGAVPPLSDAEWGRLFGLYQAIPQYSLVNDGLGLDGFKRIFWLEWVHRFWGRLLGVAFAIPLLWFTVTGRLDRRLLPRLVVFLVLGGLQGAVGWFMVASGFFPDATAVAPSRLVIHLLLALLLYSVVLWTAFTLLPPGAKVIGVGRAAAAAAHVTLWLVALTIAAGGFVAGLKAGHTYNTFPLMDGRVVPEGYASLSPFSRNLIENIAAVQFNHRLLATLTLVSVLTLIAAAWRYRDLLGWRLYGMAGAVIVQFTLGVATLLLAVPAELALPHQIGAVLLLTAVLSITHAIRPSRGAHHGQRARHTPFHGIVTRSAAPSGAKDSAP